MEKPYESHSGGVIVLDYSITIDFKQVGILSLEEVNKLNSIILNGASIMKDSNDLKVLLFSDKDTLTLELDHLKSENAIMILCKKKINTKHDTTSK
jgi:hypothetical protein